MDAKIEKKSSVNNMVIRVVEFSSGGTKLERFLQTINIPKGNDWILSFGLMASCQE